MQEMMELEEYHDLELHRGHMMYAEDKEKRVRRQRVRWRISDVRTKVVHQQREDLRLLERDLLAQRQVQELGVLAFEKKRHLQEKLQEAIAQAALSNSSQKASQGRQKHLSTLLPDFDAIVDKMHSIQQEYSYDFRMPKNDVREDPRGLMCMACGRITCDCHEQRECEDEKSSGSLHNDLNKLHLTPTGDGRVRVKRRRYYNQQDGA